MNSAESDDDQPHSTKPSTVVSAIGQHAVELAVFAVVTAAAVVLTQIYTKDRIAMNQAQARMQALYQLAPVGSFDNDLSQDRIALEALRRDNDTEVSVLGPLPADAAIHIVRKAGQIVQWLLPVMTSEGYTTGIKLWVGIYPDGRVSGVRVVQHQETPGLGDKIELKKSDWILQFDGKHLKRPPAAHWAVKKDGGDFDQLTGATITSRAVIRAVKQALVFYQETQPLLKQSAAE